MAPSDTETTAALLAHYARLPYQGRAHYPAHIDRMATLAALFDLPAAPITAARVLEVGCADGTNLLNMATSLPGSTFVGLDLFEGHIARGRQAAAALGLDNVTLLTGDLCTPPDLGDFDYIVAHGVYSWVPAPVRDALLALIRDRLRPEGLAMVSYNIEPGWSLYRPIRDLMRWHTRNIDDPTAVLGESRAVARFLRDVLPASHPRRPFLDHALSELDAASDDYVYHEYLEPVNEPVWFRDFVAHAAKWDLQYVGESSFPSMLADSFPPAVQETLHRLGGELHAFEQYRDILSQRRFRSSLLTHAARSLDRTVTLQPLLSLSASLPFDAVASAGSLDLTHRSHPETTITVSEPLHRAALSHLAARYPEAVPFSALATCCAEALGAAADAPLQTALADLLMQLYRQGALELFTVPPPVTASVSARPVAPPLVRRQAAADVLVCSPRHEMFRLNPLEQAVAVQCDGTRDHAALAASVAPLLSTGGDPALEALGTEALATQIVAQSLRRLARDGMLTR